MTEGKGKRMPVGAMAAVRAGPAPMDEAAAIRKRLRDDRIAKERAERKRVVDLSAPDAGLKHNADLGAPLAIKRGLVEYDKAALVPVDPNEKNGQQVRGARAQRIWAPERLSRGRNPMVTPEGLQAAERFRFEWCLAEYGLRGGQDEAGVRVDPWARLPYSERRAMCRQSSAMAATKIGPRAWGIVRWCVLEITPGPEHPATADAFARTVGWGTERAVAMLGTALDVLAVHYGYTKQSSHATIAPGRREGDGS